MKTTLSAIFTTAALCLASQASAATIDFSNAGTGAAGATGLGGVTYTTAATYGTTLLPALSSPGSVSVSQFGLGTGFLLDNPGGSNRIDGMPNGTWEMVTVTFSAAVNLADFILGRMDTNDDFEYSINGGIFTHVEAPSAALITTASPGSNPLGQLYTFTANWLNVTSFSIRASGDFSRSDGLLGNDDFTLAAANVTAITPVPLPAGAPLLLAGLAGLAALRRRKRAA